MALETSLSIKIVGGGIAGLMSAVTLRRGGHSVEIFERSSSKSESGTGIGLAPHAVMILQEAGIDVDRDIGSSKWHSTSFIRADTLEVLKKDLIESDEPQGPSMISAHRADLHSALKRLALNPEGRGHPVTLRGNENVTGYNPDTGAIYLENGSMEIADLIVAADGVHSIAASLINETQCPATATDMAQLRFMLSTETIMNDNLTSPLLKGGCNDAGFYMLPGSSLQMIRYPCRSGTLQNFGFYISAETKSVDNTKLKSTTPKELLRKHMKSLHPALRRLSDLVSDVSLWQVLARKPVSKLQSGKMVAVGDASHPMMPYRGQGAVSAIEDAAVLGTLFSSYAQSRIAGWSISEKLQLFENIRKSRVSVTQIMSEVPVFADPIQTKKAELLLYFPESELPTTPEKMRQWFFEYDYHVAIQNALDSLLAR